MGKPPGGRSGRAFAAAGDETAFESGRTYRIREEEGPQLRLCLLRGERSALAVTMNHMIADGAGFKEYLYFLCDCYSHLGGRDAESRVPSRREDRRVPGHRRRDAGFRAGHQASRLVRPARRQQQDREGWPSPSTLAASSIPSLRPESWTATRSPGSRTIARPGARPSTTRPSPPTTASWPVSSGRRPWKGSRSRS